MFIKNSKNLIREWVSTLSVEELLANEELIKTYERIEKTLNELERISQGGLYEKGTR